jgi:glycosyltransferase involved in cell wall biosynthesis
LAIVGDGEARGIIGRDAEEVNRRLGAEVVLLAGPMLDPRPAYAAADVVVGMGSSVLRGMAFGKPALVLGERGFSKVVEPDTLDWFLFHGFYGVGDGDTGTALPAQHLRALLRDGSRRRELGELSRRIVCERFSVRAAAKRLERVYQDSMHRTTRVGEISVDTVGTSFRLARQKVRSAPTRRETRRRRAERD